MTAEEIRGYRPNYADGTFIMLREIAAQLAEQNERQAKFEPLTAKSLELSVRAIERAEAELEKI
jgi:hypothetical protein